MAGSNVLTYSRIDPVSLGEKITWVSTAGPVIQTLTFNSSTQAFTLNPASQQFGFPLMIEAVETADLGVYKDSYQKNVYFRDVVVGKPLAVPYFSFGTSSPINFQVYRYN